MTMIRKQLYLEPAQDAKLKRIARASGRTEAEIVREAIERMPEPDDPVLAKLRAAGLVAEPLGPVVSREEAQAAFEEYLAAISGRGPLGLTAAVLEDRAEQP